MDNDVQPLLHDIDIYVVPCVNPDGYEITRNKDRLWRKTLSRHGRCFGVDLNRNFPFFFGSEGTSDDPCDKEIYRGPYPLSEPEAKGLATFLLAHRRQIGVYVALHAYGNQILYPWGHTVGAVPPDVADLVALAKEAAAAIKAVHGTQYEVMNSAHLYPAAGASDDYAKSIGIKYAYTIEMTNDFYEFFATPDLIRPTAEEVFAALMVFADKVRAM